MCSAWSRSRAPTGSIGHERDVRAVQRGQPRVARGLPRRPLDLGTELGTQLHVLLDQRDAVAQQRDLRRHQGRVLGSDHLHHTSRHESSPSRSGRPRSADSVAGPGQHRVSRCSSCCRRRRASALPRRGRPLDLGSLSFPALETPRRQVLDALLDLCTTSEPEVAAAVLGLGPTQTEAVLADARLTSAPTARADTVYSGVLYEALDIGTLDASGATPSDLVARGHVRAVRAAAADRPDPRLPAVR